MLFIYLSKFYSERIMCCVNEKLNEATVELDKNIKKKQSSSL